MTHDTAAYQRQRRARVKADALNADLLLSKYEAPCCAARVDAVGRWPVGYCSPGCERRSGRYAK